MRTALATECTVTDYQHLSEAASTEAGGGKNAGSGAGSQASCPISSQAPVCPALDQGAGRIGREPAWQWPGVQMAAFSSNSVVCFVRVTLQT